MRLSRLGILLCVLMGLAACDPGGFSARKDNDNPFAPDIDPKGKSVDGLVVGHRLMQAGQFELALDAFQRAGAEHGLTAEVLSALGTANLALGRLNQAERLLRRAVKSEDTWPEVWNNLGVVLMERGKTAEAAAVFRKAFALDNGQSDSIRENLRLALEKIDTSVYEDDTQQEYKLVRRGSSDYLIRTAP